jgi:hypothetical protein
MHDRYATSGVRLIEMSKPKKSGPSCNKDRKSYFSATEFVWSTNLPIISPVCRTIKRDAHHYRNSRIAFTRFQSN